MRKRGHQHFFSFYCAGIVQLGDIAHVQFTSCAFLWNSLTKAWLILFPLGPCEHVFCLFVDQVTFLDAYVFKLMKIWQLVLWDIIPCFIFHILNPRKERSYKITALCVDVMKVNFVNFLNFGSYDFFKLGTMKGDINTCRMVKVPCRLMHWVTLFGPFLGPNLPKNRHFVNFLENGSYDFF